MITQYISAIAQNPEGKPEIQNPPDCITIDGRTYKISPEFKIPPGIDTDFPVKLIFTNDTHELLSIERLIHKWMETSETTEERQALVNNSLHTLAVLENTYARLSGIEAKSVMRYPPRQYTADKKQNLRVSHIKNPRRRTLTSKTNNKQHEKDILPVICLQSV